MRCKRKTLRQRMGTLPIKRGTWTMTYRGMFTNNCHLLRSQKTSNHLATPRMQRVSAENSVFPRWDKLPKERNSFILNDTRITLFRRSSHHRVKGGPDGCHHTWSLVWLMVWTFPVLDICVCSTTVGGFAFFFFFVSDWWRLPFSFWTMHPSHGEWFRNEKRIVEAQIWIASFFTPSHDKRNDHESLGILFICVYLWSGVGVDQTLTVPNPTVNWVQIQQQLTSITRTIRCYRF